MRNKERNGWLVMFLAVTMAGTALPARAQDLLIRGGTDVTSEEEFLADVLVQGGIYSGWEITGWPVMTIRRGSVVFEDGEIRARPGSGQLLRRSASSRQCC